MISFAESDDPSPDAQQEAIELFEALAFAGLDRDQYDCLWVLHAILKHGVVVVFVMLVHCYF